MAFRCVLRWYNPCTWLVILLFVAPVARHTIAGRKGRIVFGSILVLSGIIMVLDTAGAPLIRCAEYERWRSGACGGGTILFVRRYDSRTPKKFLFVVPAMSRWSSSVVRVVAILHTNKNQATHTHILTSICRVKAPRPGTIGRGAGRMRRSCSQFRLYLRQEVTRTQILVVEEKESNGNIETVAVARKSPSSKMLHIHSRPHQQCVPYFDTSIIVIIIIIIIHSSSSSSRKKQ